MATSNNRDVKMTLSVETLGEDGIKQLRDSVASLAKEGGDAAPEFQRLAAEIEKLGVQAAALGAFEKLSEETSQLTLRQKDAGTALDELRAKLDATKTSVAGAAAEHLKARSSYDQAKVALEQINGELTVLRSTYDENGKRSTTYKSDVEKLTIAKVAQKKVISEAAAALATTKDELRGVEAAERKLQGQVDRSTAAFDKLSTKASAAGESLKQEADALNTLGIATDNIAQAQAQLVQSLNSVADAARRRKESADELRESDRLLAIEARTLAEQMEKGRIALLAENAAQLDLAAQVRATTKAKQESEAAAAAAADAWQKEAFAIVEAAEAAQKLKLQTEALAEAQRALVAVEAFQRQADEARKLVQAAEYVNFWKDALDKADAAAARVAQEAKQMADETAAASKRTAAAAQEMADAWSAIGTRGPKELRDEIERVRQAAALLATQGGITGRDLSETMARAATKVKALELELREATGTLTTVDKAARLFSSSLGQLTAGNLIADGIASIVSRVQDLGRAFVTANVQSDSLRRGLDAVYNDAKLSAQQFEFLREVADKAGVSFSDISADFLKFAAATKESNIPLHQSQQVFEAVTVAAGTLGLGAGKVSNALNALGQIASKGTLQMEELRGQLGDAIPGALSLTSRGLGVTDAQLIKLIETGGVAAKDFFPAFVKGLSSMQGSSDSLRNTWERLLNAGNKLFTAIGDTGVVSAMKSGLDSVTKAVNWLGENITAVSATIGGFAKAFLAVKVAQFALDLLASARAAAAATTSIVAKTAAVVANTTATVANTAATAANAVATNASIAANTAKVASVGALGVAMTGLRGAVGSVFSVLGGWPVLLATVALNYRELGTAIGEFAGRMAALATGQKTLEQSSKELAAADAVAVEAARKLAIARDEERAANERVEASRFGLTQAGQAAIVAFDKMIAEGKKTSEVIGNIGKDFDLSTVPGIRNASAVLDKLYFDGKITSEQFFNTWNESLKGVNLAEFQRKFSAAMVGVDRSMEQTSRVIDATLRQAIGRAGLDFAQISNGMSKATQSALADVDTLVKSGDRLKSMGVDVATALSASLGKAIETASSQKEIDALRAKIESLRGVLGAPLTNSLLEQIKVQADEAKKAVENLVPGFQSGAEAMRQLGLTSTAELKKIADSSRAAYEAVRNDSLSSTEDAAAAFRKYAADAIAANKGVATSTLNAEAAARGLKIVTDETGKSIVVGMNDAKASIDRVGDSYTMSAELAKKLADAQDLVATKYMQSSKYTADQIALLEKENDLVQRRIDLENKRRGVDANGFSTDKSGNTVVAGGDLNTRTGIFNFLKAAGVTDDNEARRITSEFSDSKGDIPYINNPGQLRYGGAGSTISQALLKAAEKYTFSGGSQKSAPAVGGIPSRTVNINIGGRSTSVGVSSDQDAAALEGVLRQIESASLRSA